MKTLIICSTLLHFVLSNTYGQVGVGTPAIADAIVLLDGSEELLHSKWKYWDGPRLKAVMPIKWKLQADPTGGGSVLNSNDPAAAGGLYGSADIVTIQEFEDFRLHIEFYISEKGGNSGVYLQNRYEIQVLDGDSTSHGMGTVINESLSPYYAYKGIGQWNSYDLVFRAAKFVDGKLTEKPLVTMYFNGKKAHTNQPISQVWGGPNSGQDGGNEQGKGITNRPGGLKLQAEGHNVLYRNCWIKPLNLEKADTDF
jgi:Domain of Unknown Function (DUF1080)